VSSEDGMLCQNPRRTLGVQATAYSLRFAALHSGFQPRLTPSVRLQKISLDHLAVFSIWHETSYGISDHVEEACCCPHLESVWKQNPYKRSPYVTCRAKLRTDLLDNQSLAILLEIPKRLICRTLVSGQPLSNTPVEQACAVLGVSAPQAQ
jgi:hypothetical protein